jgi:hypothetical protein
MGLKTVPAELEGTNNYGKHNNMKLINKGKDDSFTERVFVYGRYEDKWHYLNIRLCTGQKN